MDRYPTHPPLGMLIIALFAGIMFLSGCASKRTMVVLVPDPGGKTGAVTVSNSAGMIGIDAANQATTIDDPNTPPSPPVAMQQEEIEKIFAQALKAQPAAPVHFILYFISDSNELRPDSLDSLPKILETIKERNSIDISIVGHTDTKGGEEYNYALSRKRAEAVARLLVGRGVRPEQIRTTSHGEENPLIQTGDNVDEPKNRRVEVVVR